LREKNEDDERVTSIGEAEEVALADSRGWG